MNSMSQGLVGAGIAVIVFAAGVGIGRATGGTDNGAVIAEPARVQVVFPDRLNLDISGISSDRAACLDWVSRHFEGPNVGQFAMMCGAGSR